MLWTGPSSVPSTGRTEKNSWHSCSSEDQQSHQLTTLTPSTSTLAWHVVSVTVFLLTCLPSWTRDLWPPQINILLQVRSLCRDVTPSASDVIRGVVVILNIPDENRGLIHGSVDGKKNNPQLFSSSRNVKSLFLKCDYLLLFFGCL